MSFSPERRLLSAFLLLCLAAVASAGLMERRLTNLLMHRVEADLSHQARLSALALGGVDTANSQEVALALGAAVEARITIVRAGGRVTGDSEVTEEALSGLDNHADRPEIVAALDANEVRLTRRYSRTLQRDMMYAAVPIAQNAGGGVLRIAQPLDAVYAEVRAFRLLFYGAGAAGLFLAGGLTVTASQQARRELLGLLNRVAGRLPESGQERSREEMSLEALSASLEETLAALVAERDRFETVINGMRGGVLALNAEGLVTVANPYSRRLFGLNAPPDGRPLLEVLPLPDVLAIAEGALKGEEGAVDVSLPARPAASGHVRPFRLLITATPQATGGCLLLAYDVTELRELEELRREFVANVSHELRTPVSAVLTSAEALAAGALEEPELAADFVAAIHRNAERLGALITDLLRLSHIESGALELRAEEVEVAQVVWRVREALWGLADQRSQKLETDVPMDLVVRGDGAALERVLLNLVENACKYTQDGSRVRVLGRAEGHEVILEVLDDGPGVPETHRARVFERFYRVDRGRSRKMGGTGLGLAIVQELVEAMDGRIELLPGEPHGAAFRVTLRAV